MLTRTQFKRLFRKKFGHPPAPWRVLWANYRRNVWDGHALWFWAEDTRTWRL